MELKPMSFSEYELQARLKVSDPLIIDLVDCGDFVIIHAISKVGKSMLALNIMSCVASGEPFLDFETYEGKVLYLQTELQDHAVIERLRKINSKLPPEKREKCEQNSYFLNNSIRLDKKEGIESLRKAIRALKPSLVILDPFYTLHRLNENNGEEMAPILTSLRDLTREEQTTMILIHHQGKRGENQTSVNAHQARGSSAFGDVPDMIVGMYKSKENEFYISATCRNREAIEKLALIQDSETLTFKRTIPTPKKPKTSELILDAISSSDTPIGREEIYHFVTTKSDVKADSARKSLDGLIKEGKVVGVGKFKDTKFKIATKDELGGSPPP